MSKILLIFVLLFSASCSEYNKIPYFQDLDKTKTANSIINNYVPLKIQPGDVLGINVTGNRESMASLTLFTDLPSSPLYGYKVSSAGEIKLPLINTIQVADLTTEEIKAKLTTALSPYIGGLNVDVRIINLKIYVLGDVARPNEYTIQNEKINILQALALAGDLNITAKRENVILMREENGFKRTYPVDLTSKKVFDLPYFYLKNNDVLIVEPSSKKLDQVDTKGYRTATLALSAISVLSLIVSAVFLNRN
ncbi:MAG: polysaccharide export protein [Sphingobacteriaceae bacterium]|nr:MAG: polysaccharide export protein [Sphingobacteriaceae bacterium]